jgi:hypothetical protein
MKQELYTPTVEMSDDFSSSLFSIGDASIVFDILRSKLYSNPISAVCREYSCNARDSHREAGKQDQPIQISLPNNLEPHYKIKDFGVGISPDRIENIFIKYGSSTKRDDNSQTGFFGMGSKCAFSVTDTFSVNTVFDGVKYNYQCLIDPSKIGKLLLLNSMATDLPNETEIIIPVKNKDFNEFKHWTEHSTKHWDVKPIIKGGSINYTTPEVLIEGNSWKLIKQSNYNRDIKLIIDGIEYPLDRAAFKQTAQNALSIVDAGYYDTILYFGIGELSLSASREQIYLDEKTQKKITSRLIDLKKEIVKNIEEEIKNCKNLFEANVYYSTVINKTFHNRSALGDLTWKGFKLTSSWSNIPCIDFYREGSKIKRHTHHYLDFSEKTNIWLNDLDLSEPNPKHVKLLFEDPSVTLITLINPSKLNKNYMEELLKKNPIDQLDYKLLSTVVNQPKKINQPDYKILVYKFNPVSKNFIKATQKEAFNDKNAKILCITSKDEYHSNFRRLCQNGKIVNTRIVTYLSQAFPKVTIYAVDEELDLKKDKIKEKFKDFIDIEVFLEKNIVQSSLDFLKIKSLLSSHDEYFKQIADKISSSPGLLINSSSSFHNLCNFYLEKKLISDTDKIKTSLFESLKEEISMEKQINWLKSNPKLDVGVIKKEILSDYPMLNHFNGYYADNKAIKNAIDYINLVDKK